MRIAAIFLIGCSCLRGASIEERQTIQRSYVGSTKMLVDNIDGSIHITGAPGNQVQMKAEETIVAESPEAMAEAKRDVKLDISEQGSFLRIYEDGPFREHDRGWRFYNYRVKFDYDIQVPKGIELVLRTVNGGEISVKGVDGAYDIGNVNGGVTLEQMGGSGRVSGVNGPIKVWFSRNPAQDSKFHTVNGGVEVHFQPSLSADLSFKTLNGHVYTDFDVYSRPGPPGTTEEKNGRFIYRGNRFTTGRVGKGGPELSFETVNGSIRLQTK